jgi:hypothetical protein
MPAAANRREDRFRWSYRRFRLPLIPFAALEAKNRSRGAGTGRFRPSPTPKSKEQRMSSITTDDQIMNTWARVRHELVAIIVLALLLLAMGMFSAPVASAADEPRLQSNGAVEYLSGGVGKEEADALKQHSADYPLTLEFASSRSAEGNTNPGAYVADVKVDIRDAHGRPMLNTTSTGPLLLVRLPPGDYTVAADWNGVRKQHSVDLPEGARRHVVFMW